MLHNLEKTGIHTHRLRHHVTDTSYKSIGIEDAEEK